jgi:hypothetical protein
VIASRLDTPRQIDSKWRKRFAVARLPGLEAQSRGGRKAHFSLQSRRSDIKAAAWDVHRARVFGRCEVKSGIVPVNRLVGELWGKSLINPLAAAFGSWTIALLIEDRRLPTAYVTGGPT